MDLGLRGRAALVGGGSAGLGRATAEALAAEGCRLLIWSRDESRLRIAADELRGRHGVEVHHAVADASRPEAATTIADAAQARLGTVDVLVLNAGGPPTVDPTATDPEEWRRILQLLTITPIEIASRLLPGMRDAGWGRVIAIMSSGVRQPIAELVYSNAGRSALAAWLKTTARSIAKEGVTVNGVMPGRLSTARVSALDAERGQREGRTQDEVRADHIGAIPAGRYGRPEELGALVAFLASEPAGYITGQLIAVDGGLIAGI